MRDNSACYIALDSGPKGTKTTDVNFWALICKDGTDLMTRVVIGLYADSNIVSRNNFIETYNQHTESVNPDQNFGIGELLGGNVTIKDKKFYYACKQSDMKCSLNSKKPKWNLPIAFEKIIDIGASYDNVKSQIIFNKPGTYKITIHINFTGVNYFKVINYLLKPHENPLSDSYHKDRKIPSSKMSMASSKQMKNHLHYDFIVNVADALSTLILMSAHKLNKLKNMTDYRTSVFGKEKSWIFI